MRTLLVMGALLAGGAQAADRNAAPVIGAAPAWVRPATVGTPDPAAADAAVQVLLLDEQYDLRPRLQQRYFETAYKLQTAQGLAAGHIALAWNPDTQSVTVHKLHIVRDGKIIDVLAAGQTFTVVRREQNLENAALDGVLTATLQPEGLQVGDIVDFAATVTNRDPALGDHIEMAGAVWNGFPVRRAQLRAQWPANVTMQIRAAGDFGAVRPVRQDDLMVAEITREGLKPLVAPAGAPQRYGLGRLVQLSDRADWAGIADLMTPLYRKAAAIVPGSPLATEADRIAKASADPTQRAEAALALVQDRVRYVFLGMNDGGLVPSDAELTWSRRFGDCKAKTGLLLALLHRLGIEAAPVLVSTALGDGLDQRLPMVGVFDHVLVRAVIAGKPYWLDGTRLGDRHLAGIAVPAFHWGLPLVAGSRALAPIMPGPLAQPDTDMTLRIDATKGVRAPAPSHAERLIRGDGAVVMNLQLANLAADARDQQLREFWRGKYDFITAKAVKASFDADRREMLLSMDGDAKMDWNNGWYEADGVWVGYKADFARDPAADQQAPFAVGFPSYTRTRETILLPPGERFTTDPSIAAVDQTVAGVHYLRHADVTGTVFTVEESEQAIQPEFAAKDAPAAQATLRALAKRTVYLRLPDHYVATGTDVTAIAGDTPTDTAGLVTRGAMFMDQGELDKAGADFDAAIGKDPRNVYALADRGLVRAYRGDAAGAARDLDAAAAIDSNNTVMLHGRAMLALQRNDVPAGIAFLTRAITLDPRDDFALSRRAQAEHQVGQDDAALKDAAAALMLRPTLVDMALLRANVFRNRGSRAEALAEMRSVIAANPTSDYALVAAANLMAALGERAEAMTAFDRALALKPSSYIYLNRSMARDPKDLAGREADLDQAIRLDPTGDAALAGKASLLIDRKDWAGALALLTKAHTLGPANAEVLLLRANVYTRSGQPTLAVQDLTAARALAKMPVEFNNLCWFKATHRVALDSAVADCDAALATMSDSAGFLDSRGLALLQLGRFADAVASYDRALAKAPIAGSLYGRAVAEAALGRRGDAARDLAAARKLNPDVAQEFAGYGVTPPPT